MSGERRPRVVIVGAGFGGLACARALHGAPVEVVLVDRHNYHVFTPLLYQVATALLEPAEVAQPVRQLLQKLPGVDFRLGDVTGVDLDARVVQSDRGPLAYDHLVLAAGAVNDYFGNREIAKRSLGLGTLSESLALRNAVLERFEQAAWTEDPVQRRRLLTFAVVGGGPTGVEFAGAFAELVHEALARDYPHLDLDRVEIVLVEGSSAPLSTFAPKLQRASQRALEGKGVRVLSGAKASAIDEQGLRLDDGRTIGAATVAWAAGVRAASLADGLELEQGSHARLKVLPTLQVPGRPEVLVVGDMAAIPQAHGRPESLPMLAQVAIQSGRHAGEAIAASLHGRSPQDFRYRDLGTMATQGRNAAVAQIGPLKLSGMLGWLAWLLVHIVALGGLRTRLLVLINWAAAYLLTERPVRLIAGTTERPDEQEA